jgi:hypothetical protein
MAHGRVSNFSGCGDENREKVDEAFTLYASCIFLQIITQLFYSIFYLTIFTKFNK